jgi:GAF domain-containing protein
MINAAKRLQPGHPRPAGVRVEDVVARYKILTLDHMNSRLHAEMKLERAISRILNDSMSLTGAEFGNVQLLSGDFLLIADQRNFKRPFLETFRKVATEHGSACGRALRSGETVVVEDTELDGEFAPFRPAARLAGFRSVVTTPLLTHANRLLGVVSTHFVSVHRPTDVEIETFEGYSVSAGEHLSRLLGKTTLDSFALKMNRRLYGEP